MEDLEHVFFCPTDDGDLIAGIRHLHGAEDYKRIEAFLLDDFKAEKGDFYQDIDCEGWSFVKSDIVFGLRISKWGIDLIGKSEVGWDMVMNISQRLNAYLSETSNQ